MYRTGTRCDGIGGDLAKILRILQRLCEQDRKKLFGYCTGSIIRFGVVPFTLKINLRFLSYPPGLFGNRQDHFSNMTANVASDHQIMPGLFSQGRAELISCFRKTRHFLSTIRPTVFCPSDIFKTRPAQRSGLHRQKSSRLKGNSQEAKAESDGTKATQYSHLIVCSSLFAFSFAAP